MARFCRKKLESLKTPIKNSEKVPVKVVLTKCDIVNEGDRKFKKEDVENYLSNISEETYKKLEINKTVIETSAKDNTGINYKKGELRNPETCLEDYLLNLFDQQKQSSNNENKKEGFVKKHPVISIGALATVLLVTPLLIFKNKIVNGVKNIFGKNQNQKPTAKRIKAN